MWLISLRDLQWRLRRFAISVLATGVAFGLSLVMTGVITSLHNEGERTVALYQADHWLVAEGASGPFTALLSCELSPGGSVGRHVQQEFSELVLGLDGQGQASVDGHSHALGAGDVVHVPLGAVLAIENLGEHPLRYLIIKARG